MEVTLQIALSTAPCPACSAPMTRLVTLSGTVAGCLCCGGIWIDHIFGRKVIEGTLAATTKGFLRHVAEQAAGVRPADYRTAGRREERTCPDCQAALAPQRFGPRGIVLDLCATHGTFFDLREVEAIVVDVEMQKAVAQVEAERRAELRDRAIFDVFDGTRGRW